MKKENNKKQNGRAVKRLLLESGIALFAEKGYASTSVREIVEGAGVTKPVLYYYFKSKEGMFHAILNWAHDQLEIMLADVLQFPGTAFDRFVYFYRHLYDGEYKLNLKGFSFGWQRKFSKQFWYHEQYVIFDVI